jgi:hypothetical protein
VEQFKARWPLDTRQHPAFCLTEFLGQRPSDTHRLACRSIASRMGCVLFAGVRMAEVGCTDEEMMAVLGHKSVTSLRTYTKGAQQRRLAGNAITKLEQNRQNLPQRAVSNLGNCRKEREKQTLRKSLARHSE